MKRDKHIGQVPQTPFVARGAEAGQQGALEAAKHRTPVGGVPMPNIPRFDQHARAGATMAAQAAPSVDRIAEQRGILAGGGQQPDGLPPILPTDTLPDAAKKDPRFGAGMGSELAITNPELAYQYGIIRSGQHLMLPTGAQPDAVSDEEPRVGRWRQSTLDGLEKIAADQRQQLGGASVSGTVPAPTEGVAAMQQQDKPPEKELDKEELQEFLANLDQFEMTRLQAETRVNIYNTPEQRRIIESRLKPLSIDELLMNGTVQQVVPIIPPTADSHGFVVTFEHISGTTDLKFKEMVSGQCRALDLGDAYFTDLYSMLTLTAAVRRINSKVFPEYRDDKGRVVTAQMWERFYQVSSNILPMLASLSVNYTWFDDRVRKLFKAEEVKNG